MSLLEFLILSAVGGHIFLNKDSEMKHVENVSEKERERGNKVNEFETREEGKNQSKKEGF